MPRLKINTFSYLFYILLLVIRKTTNIFFKKNHLRQPLLLQGCAKKSANIFFAACQLSLLIQYLTLGAFTSPWIKPASFNSFKCCETVALAKQDSCFFGDIHEELPIAKATVSQHLKELKEAGLIQGEIETPKVRYCINWENWELARNLFAAFLGESKSKGTSCCD